ncbi:ATP-binding protein [Amedibacillus dolichus]|uniref:ATP-binding protein n=1 Tax=Amedibacillus dolichus TaxID=31971 RepID=A0ABT7UEE6_9FIRM|nr:ATP-binding protein [Amedibacillus dolichus]MDM8158002.1 ATP-binding protein [Amedibacillus dolichus]
MGHSIFNIRHMSDGLRNTGYKDITSAAAEIVDNSIEAEAKNIFIIFTENVSEKTGRQQVSEIAFLDDGYGMNDDVLGRCLALFETTRYERKGLGRFGVGLPQSSMFASSRAEVYSWQNGIEQTKKVYLDLDMVNNGDQEEIPDPFLEPIPDRYKRYISFIDDDKQYDFRNHGTLVVWSKYDKSPKKRTTLFDKFEFGLGKKFRYFITGGLCEIRLFSNNNISFNRKIKPNDPLMLMENNMILGDPSKPDTKFYYGSKNGLVPIFEPYGNEQAPNGIIPLPVKYIDKKGEVKDGVVEIQFSIVKKEFYDQNAFKYGKNPGDYEIGQHVKHLSGISVVRANREIDFRDFDFYSDVNTPNNRWWGCEIRFDPEMDEAFGVSNNKQYVELHETDNNLDDDVESLWKQLSDVIRPTIINMQKQNSALRKKPNQTEDGELTNTESADIVNDIEDNDEDSYTSQIKDHHSEEELLEKLKEKFTDFGFADVEMNKLKTILNNKVYVTYKPGNRMSPFFEYNLELGTIIVQINTGHPMFSSFIEYLPETGRTTFELLLCSFADAVNSTQTHQADANDLLVSTWLNKLNIYVNKQLAPKKGK